MEPEVTSKKKDNIKFDTFYVRLCSTEIADYIKCLNLQNEKIDKKYNCQEVKTKYLACINSNNYNSTR